MHFVDDSTDALEVVRQILEGPDTGLPPALRGHLIDRMRDRAISLTDLHQSRVWIASEPEVPDGEWYKDFGSSKICGQGPYPKILLVRGQAAKGAAL